MLKGPDIALQLVPETASKRGVQRITLRVKHVPKEQTKIYFGPRSAITFHENGTATWSFDRSGASDKNR